MINQAFEEGSTGHDSLCYSAAGTTTQFMHPMTKCEGLS
jgi:hypothetical protein